MKRECYGKHAAGCIPVHKVHVGIKKKERGSPRLAERDRARGLHADAPASERSGTNCPAPDLRAKRSAHGLASLPNVGHWPHWLSWATAGPNLG